MSPNIRAGLQYCGFGKTRYTFGSGRSSQRCQGTLKQDTDSSDAQLGPCPELVLHSGMYAAFLRLDASGPDSSTLPVTPQANETKRIT